MFTNTRRRLFYSVPIGGAALLVTVALGLASATAFADGGPGWLGPNLLRNGSFDRAYDIGNGDLMPTGWTWGTQGGAQATVTLSDSETHFGHRTMRFRSHTPAAPNVFAGLSTAIPRIRPNTDYMIRLWAKGEGVGDAWFGGGPNWVVRQPFPPGDFGWTPLEARLHTPANAPADFEFRINVDSATGSLWVTNIAFQEVNPPATGQYGDYSPTPVQPGGQYGDYPPTPVQPQPGAPYAYPPYEPYYPPYAVAPPYYDYGWWDPGYSVVVPFYYGGGWDHDRGRGWGGGHDWGGGHGGGGGHSWGGGGGHGFGGGHRGR